jgi:hypothetical protein
MRLAAAKSANSASDTGPPDAGLGGLPGPLVLFKLLGLLGLLFSPLGLKLTVRAPLKSPPWS